MKGFIFLIIIGCLACNNASNGKPAANKDTVLYPSHPTLQGDTDDHNKPSPEQVPLDEPVEAVKPDSVKK